MANPQFASLAAAAEITGVSARSIRRYIAAGRIMGFRVGPRLIRVDINELQNLVSPIIAEIDLHSSQEGRTA